MTRNESYRSDAPPDRLKSPFANYLLKIWKKGWFDEYSDDHYIIRSLNGQLDTFSGYENMLQICSGPFSHNLETVHNSFFLSLSKSIELIEECFSEKDAMNFVVEKLSGGKSQYSEDQYLRALSELTVIKWFCLFTRGKVVNRTIYEPRLQDKRNPEARFIRDDVIIDVEVKTPGFIPKNDIRHKVTPIVLINDKGRKELDEMCVTDGIELRLPDINKLKQHLNDAASKFEVPKNKRHFNVLFINWTYCDFPISAFLEPYSLLMNENGVLRNKALGMKIGFDESVYNKITAIILYNENIDGYVNQDLRHIWSHRTFALAINPYLDCDVSALENTLQMESNRNISPIPLALYDYFAKNEADSTDLNRFNELMNTYNTKISKYLLR